MRVACYFLFEATHLTVNQHPEALGPKNRDRARRQSLFFDGISGYVILLIRYGRISPKNDCTARLNFIMELCSVVVQRSQVPNFVWAIWARKCNAALLSSLLIALFLILDHGGSQNNGASNYNWSTRQRLLNFATREPPELMLSGQKSWKGQLQQLWGDSSYPEDDNEPEMPVRWHKRPYSHRNRASVDQEGGWKVRWSREDDPETAGRMDDARWNLLSKLGTSEHSSKHDDIPAVPYYERIAQLERDAYNEVNPNQAGSDGSDEPAQAARLDTSPHQKHILK